MAVPFVLGRIELPNWSAAQEGWLFFMGVECVTLCRMSIERMSFLKEVGLKRLEAILGWLNPGMGM
jgi:hypothetical protein